jgi:hypothetical protein
MASADGQNMFKEGSKQSPDGFSICSTIVQLQVAVMKSTGTEVWKQDSLAEGDALTCNCLKRTD